MGRLSLRTHLYCLLLLVVVVCDMCGDSLRGAPLGTGRDWHEGKRKLQGQRKASLYGRSIYKLWIIVARVLCRDEISGYSTFKESFPHIETWLKQS